MAVAASGKRRSFYADLDRLRQHFSALDVDKAGYIGQEELTELVRKVSGVEESVVPELMDRLDRDKDGKVTLDDFETLFDLEREAAIKKRRVSPWQQDDNLDLLEGSKCDTSEYETALENLPSLSEILSSPIGYEGPNAQHADDSVVPESPTVVLRHKRMQRSSTLPSRFNSPRAGVMSPVRTLKNEEKPSDYPDLASQMLYLTASGYGEASESPQLKRGSKVLSWISESEDLYFEGTGLGAGSFQDASSPPLSPMRTGDEASIVKSILESVCHTPDICKESILKLCSHVQADPQEEQELLGLLDHLDTDKVGHVSLDEFVHGLQAVRNSAAIVTSTPPANQGVHLRRTLSEQITPLPLSEPFSSPLLSKHAPPFLTSTPQMTAAKDDKSKAVLSLLDLENSGYVKLESLIDQWHKMGIETASNADLEHIISEAIPVDQGGRVNVSEVVTFLEGVVLSQGNKDSVLRQVALRTFKGEISTLRSQVQQVSLERDTLRTTLNRTLEENKKLVQEGDEHVDLVTQQSERKMREQEALMTVKLREVERTRQEEALQMQDKAASMISDLKNQLETLKAEEEKLRHDLRIAQDEIHYLNERLISAHGDLAKKENTIALLQRDLGSRSEYELIDDETHLSQMGELERELTEKNGIISDLRDAQREMQDKIDLLIADNEKMKQKNQSQRRAMQRRRSSPSSVKHDLTAIKQRHSSGEKPKKRNRPLSGSHFGRSRPIRPRMHPLSYDLDLAVEGMHHPVLYEEGSQSNFMEEPVSPHEQHELEAEYLHGDSEEGASESDTQSPTQSDDVEILEDLLSKSSASLMEELHNEVSKQELEKKLEELRQEKAKLQASHKELEVQIKNMKELGSKDELYLELERNKRKQENLEQLILCLEKQCESLTASKMEIDSQLANTEDSLAKHLQDIHGLRAQLAKEVHPSKTTLGVLIEKLDDERTQFEEERNQYEKSISILKEEISKLEKYSDHQTDQSLRLDEEKAGLENEVLSLRQILERERQNSENNLKILRQKLSDAKESNSLPQHTEVVLEKVHHKTMNDEEQFQTSASHLEDGTRNECIQRTSEASQAESHPTLILESNNSEIDGLVSEPVTMQGMHSHVLQENEELRKRAAMYETRLIEAEHKANLDIACLQAQLAESQKELSDQSDLFTNEISRLREDVQTERNKGKERAEMLMSELECRFSKEIESLSVKLKETEQCKDDLYKTLSVVEDQYKTSLTTVAEISDHASRCETEIAELKENMCRAELEISVLNKDKHHLQNELDWATIGAQKEPSLSKEQISLHKSQESCETPDEPDLASDFQSSQFGRSSYEGIIAQMKFQLEELQRALVLRKSFDSQDDPELTIIKSLLRNNEILDADIRAVKTTMDSRNSMHYLAVSRKDQEIIELKAIVDREKSASKALVSASVQKLTSSMNFLQRKSHESIVACQLQIENAAGAITRVKQLLHDKDQQQAHILHDIQSDLDQSRYMLVSYKDEMLRLKSELDKSQEHVVDLNQSNDEMMERQVIVNREVEVLRNQLQGAKKSGDLEDGVHSDEAALATRVELDFSEPMEKTNEEGKVTTQAHAEILKLKHKIEQLELTIREHNAAVSQIQLEADNRVEQKVKELQHKDEVITKLEHQLEQVVTEPVEAVVHYVETQPTESFYEAVLSGLGQEALEDENKVDCPKQIAELLKEKEDMLSQHAVEMEELIQQHNHDIFELHKTLVDSTAEAPALHTTSQIVLKTKREIEKLKAMVLQEQNKSLELQSTLDAKMKEHDLLDAQFQSEHEEEVRALHQQKRHLQRQVEELNARYRQSLSEQDEQNAALLQDLVNNKADLEKQLKDKTDESYHVYQQVADLMEEKKVLMDIIHQLCVEAGKEIDVV